MSDFLGNLALRALGLREVVRPRLPSIFEPASGLLAIASAPLPESGQQESREAASEIKPPFPDTARLSSALKGEANHPVSNVSPQPDSHDQNKNRERVGIDRFSKPTRNEAPSQSLPSAPAPPAFHSSRSAMETQPQYADLEPPAESLPNKFRLHTHQEKPNKTAESAPQWQAAQTDKAAATDAVAVGFKGRVADARIRLRRDLDAPDRDLLDSFAKPELRAADAREGRSIRVAESKLVPALPASIVTRRTHMAKDISSHRTSDSESVIHVTIGRVEVQAAIEMPAPKAQPRPPVVSLDEYLRRRQKRGGA